MDDVKKNTQKEIDLESLREAILDLERSRQREIQERELAQALLKGLELIASNFEESEIYGNLFTHFKKLIPYDFACLLTESVHNENRLKVFYHSQIQFNLNDIHVCYTDYLRNIRETSRNIFSIKPQHGLRSIIEHGSALITPIENDGILYFLLLLSTNEGCFERKHLHLATKISSVIKQAIMKVTFTAKLIQSNKMSSLGEMAGGIAHEINNPLAIIHNSLSLLEKKINKGIFNPQELNSIIQDSKDTVNRIARIISGLKNVCYNSHKEEINLEATKLCDVINDTLSCCSEKMKNHQVNIKIEIADDIYKSVILLDRIKLSQVLLNLITNAYDAIVNSENPWIKIKVFKREEDSLIIDVIDSGEGIPSEISEKIFDPFFTTKGIEKGTGLGLSLCHSMTKQMNGNISLIKHKHTFFEIELPYRSAI